MLLVKSNTGELTLFVGQEVTPVSLQRVHQMFLPKKDMLYSFPGVLESPKFCISRAAAFVQKSWH